ncbi:hypothetical protein N0V90_005323 [Kalmusia sp. IMI 367209]|nr:hypothetical protein N0V90_005323 [Kalmusia sp. IMI 367209]
MSFDPLTATATDAQAQLAEGSLTSETLVQLYLSQIARYNSFFNAIIATAPEDLLYKRARELDEERANGTVRGPLHGIPILVKDNIGTVPALGLPTTCGSLTPMDAKPKKNAEVINHLLAAGVILLGKANLSAGIIPITYEADSAGPMAKSIQDLADLLDVLVDPAKTVIPEGGYGSAVNRSWDDIRIGVIEPEKWLFPHEIENFEQKATDQMLSEWKAAYEKLKGVVKVIKPVTLLSPGEASEDGKKNIWDVFQSTFKANLDEFLATVEDSKVNTLQSLLEFNEKHAEQELGQTVWILEVRKHKKAEYIRKITGLVKDVLGRNLAYFTLVDFVG